MIFAPKLQIFAAKFRQPYRKNAKRNAANLPNGNPEKFGVKLRVLFSKYFIEKIYKIFYRKNIIIFV